MKSLHINVRPLVLLGGTFDPVHEGHMAIAWHIYQLSQKVHIPVDIAMLPTPQNPLKQAATSANKRCQLLKVALRDTPFRIEREELLGPSPASSYTTLSTLREREGQSRSLIFVMGQDSVNSLDSWEHGLELPELSHIWVFGRGDQAPRIPHEWHHRRAQSVQELFLLAHGKVFFDDFIPPDISSSQIRQDLRQFKTYLNPNVYQRIKKLGLYR